MVEGATPLPVLAVLGGGNATEHEQAVAERIGGLAARHRWVVLTGGGPGVMAAACRGAVEGGGLTVGILPNASPDDSYPNPWVRLPIFTGLGMARNAVNVLSATLCVAVGGAAGTLSEVAMALKAGIPVWCYGSWSVDPPPDGAPSPRVFDDEEELIAALEGQLLSRR